MVIPFPNFVRSFVSTPRIGALLALYG